ncbi:ADP-ribosylation factor-like protein 2-binding protein [Corticium candelabrum]|uniref:ADP-ribosylation factor-like protein 2-binding protein n=1 Tax=Corticium candelabrum TaxID=121492 RepID=UPI002E26B81E|nr:ADP-ribosylation factor-like protein 2-binding protein [Corticium candelabrum]
MAAERSFEREEVLAEGRSSRSDAQFDETVGHIEDIIVSQEFEDLQNEFMEKHYHEFEDVEENKLVYTTIFKEYTSLVETRIDKELQRRMRDFQIDRFLKNLEQRKDEIDEQICDMLLTFTDFLRFKQMMLDYKKTKEGLVPDLEGLVITSQFKESKETSSLDPDS